MNDEYRLRKNTLRLSRTGLTHPQGFVLSLSRRSSSHGKLDDIPHDDEFFVVLFFRQQSHQVGEEFGRRTEQRSRSPKQKNVPFTLSAPPQQLALTAPPGGKGKRNKCKKGGQQGFRKSGQLNTSGYDVQHLVKGTSGKSFASTSEVCRARMRSSSMLPGFLEHKIRSDHAYLNTGVSSMSDATLRCIHGLKTRLGTDALLRQVVLQAWSIGASRA